MEHRFSWQMMLRRQSTHTYFYVTDPNTGRALGTILSAHLTDPQIVRMGWRPDMILQFARHLTTVVPQLGPKPLKVEVRMLVSVNGRKPQLFLDPNVDLASTPRTWGRPPWLWQIHEPLPPRGKDFSGDPYAPAPAQY